MTFKKLEKIFYKHLYLEKEKDFLPIIIATVIANRMDNESVWLMIIAPPSSGKSKVVSALSKSPEIECVSLLTPNSLISGARKKDTEDGKEASLLPRLDGRNMLIKDASTITDMHPTYRSQVFSQLRAAYDGELEKSTGLGTKNFSAKFGIILAGTPALEKMRTLESSLGERFLTFRPMFDMNDRSKIWDKIKAGGHVKSINKILSEATLEFLEGCGTPDKVLYPDAIAGLATRLVMLRADVSRDWKTGYIDFPVDNVEEPWRAAKQMSGLYTGLMHILNDKTKAINAIKRVTRHTIPYVRLRTLTVISRNKEMTLNQITHAIKVSRPTAKKVVEELYILGVITKKSTGSSKFYIVQNQYRNLFKLRPRS
ncbi:hypothetical protein LCGC14_0359130 [marine sediment metagenome]|uniref:Uncharacterized protein n=1 Tax=marine sediment metagenome TaxID=412755 RepID=A0A0F9WGL1_9ZZZZ|nr:MarR family transcriptional regulator [Candidatus Aminicenantes bacterium]